MAKTVLIDADAIRKQIETDPAVQAAGQRLARAHVKLAEVEAEARAILEKMAAVNERGFSEKAAALLHDENDAEANLEPLQTEYSKLQDAADLWERAIKLGMTELDHAKREAAGAVLRELEPELRAQQRALVEQCANCALAIRNYKETLWKLQSGGVAVDTDHIFTGSLATATEHNSAFFAWCSVLIERGLLSWSDIPEPLRRAWGVQS